MDVAEKYAEKVTSFENLRVIFTTDDAPVIHNCTVLVFGARDFSFLFTPLFSAGGAARLHALPCTRSPTAFLPCVLR